jgi:NAD(P)-dependent dehydrogenase (short-subunit alcohol dehydrogenase family)
MDLEVHGKRVLVTRGSRGIGKAIARGLALEGAAVAILARDVERLAAASAELSNGIDEAQVERAVAIRHPVRAAEVADVVVLLCSLKSVAIHWDAIAARGGAPRAIHYRTRAARRVALR